MSNKKITDLTNYATPVSSDVLPIVDVSNTTTKKVTMSNLFNILSSLFTVKDSSDTTKKFAINASGITTATTRTMTVPDADFTPVGTTLTQTMTNKSLSTGTKINTSGSDATGSLYYRASDGSLTALAPGAAGTILDISAGGLPEFIPNPSAANASTTVKGVSQEATQAQTIARTQAGSTGADLFVNPATLTTVQTYDYVADTGSSTAYAIAPTPAITAYATGQVFRFKAINANTTATPTLAVSGLASPKTIVKNGATALAIGDIAANSIVEVMYNGTAFELQTPSANSNSFSGMFKSGTTTKNSADASTSQTIAHGLGVTPKYVRLTAQASTVTSAGALATTVYNGTTQSSVSTFGAPNNVTSSTNFDISTNNASASDFQRGVVTFDATNITITWTKNGSPTGTFNILWEAQA